MRAKTSRPKAHDKRFEETLKEACTFNALGHAALLTIQWPISLGPRGTTEMQAACPLVRDYGTDTQFHRLVAAIRKYQHADLQHYQILFGYSLYSGKNPREQEIAAVLLEDKRPFASELRYCDIGLAEMNRITGLQFGTVTGSIEVRDKGVSRALAWLRSKEIQP